MLSSISGTGRGALRGREPSLEDPPLGLVGDERKGARVGGARRLRASEAPEQVAAGGVEEVFAVELPAGGNGVEPRQTRLRAVTHGDGDGVVQVDDGGAGYAAEELVERGNF